MAIIKAFRGFRPAVELADKVVTKPYDSYSQDQIRRILADNPQSFLHVIQPDFVDKKRTRPNTIARFKKSKQRFLEFTELGTLVQDKEPSLYVYTQTIEGRDHTGIIGCAAVDDYMTNVIRKHENTLTDREEVLKNYLKECDINAEPVCLTYRPVKAIKDITEAIQQTQPDYDFITTDKIRHQLWKVSSAEQVHQIVTEFSRIPFIYIADGHHRTSSSVLFAQEQRAQNPNYTGEEAFNYFMAIYFPDDELQIYEFNRLVKDLNNQTPNELLDHLAQDFEVEKKYLVPFKPEHEQQFGLYLDKCWYSLTLKKEVFVTPGIVPSLDVSILYDHILAPFLGVKDLKTDGRVGFLSGARGTNELMRLVDSGKYSCAFTLFPVKGAQFYAISDTGKIMPPKSTWIAPKLRSGMVVYSLGES